MPVLPAPIARAAWNPSHDDVRPTAFRSGFLGVASLGWSTLVQVVEASEENRRAAIEMLGSLSPNTIVLGVDERAVLVHQLVAHHEGRVRVQEIPR